MGISLEEIQVASEAWRSAVGERSVDKVVALYATDGWLLGTVDDHNTPKRLGHDRIRDYFNGFLNCDKIDAKFQPEKVLEENVMELADKTVMYAGYYVFDKVKEGKLQKAVGKFAFVYRKKAQGEGLEILFHLSGLTPTGVHTKPVDGNDWSVSSPAFDATKF
eukprot:Platyproteum_vivax@DN11152_c0_g1_i1.p1